MMMTTLGDIKSYTRKTRTPKVEEEKIRMEDRWSGQAPTYLPTFFRAGKVI